MKTLETAEAIAPLAEYAGSLAGEPILLTSAGKPIALLIPLDDATAESFAVGMNPKFQALIAAARADYAREGGISAQEMRRRLGLT